MFIFAYFSADDVSYNLQITRSLPNSPLTRSAFKKEPATSPKKTIQSPKATFRRRSNSNPLPKPSQPGSGRKRKSVGGSKQESTYGLILLHITGFFI